MSPSTSVRSARSRSKSSGARSKKRRTTQSRTRRRSQRRRRAKVIGGTLIVVALGGFLLANSDRFQRTLEEVTLPLQHEDINESRFRDQTSHAGARGLMQITPATAKVIEGLSGGQTFNFNDLSNPDINIRYGTFYLHYLIQKFGDNDIAALAAYNAGETNVADWGGSSLSLDDIPFPETRDYVENVLEKRDEYARHYRHELGLD